MKLERLRIEQLPGLPEGFVLQGLSEGINLVTAPNAFGKSSLIRALAYLLRDAKRQDPPVSLSAEFMDGEVSWQVTRTGSQITWQQDGNPVDRPALPDSDELGRYWLSMESLIAADSTDTRLATELMSDLRGGFDLRRARLDLSTRHGSPEERALRETRSALFNAEQSATRLSAEQDRLPEIELDIKHARESGVLSRQIESAQRLAKTVAEGKSLMDSLEEFPPEMESLVGIDPKALETLKNRMETSRAHIRDQELACAEGESALETLGLLDSDIGKAEFALEAAVSKLSRLQSARDQLDRQEIEAAHQVTRVHEASIALGGGDPPNLKRESLDLAEGFASALLKLEVQRDALATKIQLAGEAPGKEVVKQHERAVDALRDWLDAEAPTIAVSGVNWLLILAFAAIFASLGASVLHPALGLVCLGVSLVSIGVTWWRLRHVSGARGNINKHAAQKRFASTGLQSPTWDVEGVRRSLKSLDTALGTLIAARSLSEGAEELRTRLNSIQQALEQKALEREQLANTLGFDPAMPLTELDRFIRLAKDWDEASLSLAQSNEDIKRSKAVIQTIVGEISMLLRPWHEELPTDLDALIAQIESFQQRLKSGKKASQKLDLAKQAMARLNAEVEEREADRTAIYEKAGIDTGDEQELSRRLAQRESWSEVRRLLEACKVREAQDRRTLESTPQLIELAVALETAQLDSLSEQHRSNAEALEALIEERSQITADIKQAEAGRSLQTAVANLRESLIDLERKRDECLDSDATNLLLDEVELAYTTHHQPKVLREADELVRQVTAHEFALSLSENGQFEATDLRQDVRRELEALSTGTRMQLLLAVRLAWVRHREQGPLSLPVFLDEALTTSDESRFITVAKSLDQISGTSGIQVIYLSARRHEQDLWRAALGRDPHSIDLAMLRGECDGDEVPRFEVRPLEPIPKPVGNASEYARQLGVPSVDPMLDAGEIHLFHILRDDLDLLHRYLDSLRISSLGQLESYFQQGEPDPSHLLERCRAARAWVAAWRVGRGQPVGALELEASGAFSQRYMKEASSLAISQDISGDASLLLAALRGGALKGFQSKKIDDFEAWLNEHQFLDDRAVLSRDERQQRVLASYDLKQHDRIGDIAQCIGWLEAGVIRGSPRMSEESKQQS